MGLALWLLFTRIQSQLVADASVLLDIKGCWLLSDIKGCSTNHPIKASNLSITICTATACKSNRLFSALSGLPPYSFLSHLYPDLPIGQSSDSCNSAHAWRCTVKLQEVHLTSLLLLISLLGKGRKKRKKKGGNCLSGLYRSSTKPFVSCHFLFSLNL